MKNATKITYINQFIGLFFFYRPVLGKSIIIIGRNIENFTYFVII